MQQLLCDLGRKFVQRRALNHIWLCRTAVQRALRPTRATISAASAELDVLPPSDAKLAANEGATGTQIYQSVLSYSFEVAPEGDDKLQAVMPRLQTLHNQLYDAPLDSMLWRLSAATGEVLAYGGSMHDAAEQKLKVSPPRDAS